MIMAAYFIDHIKTYASTNNKGRELQQYIEQFTQRLVKDDLAMDALKVDIEQEIERLNKAYPRTQPLVLDSYKGRDYGQWTAWVKENSDKIVFILDWKEVLGTYRFNEHVEKKLEQKPHLTINNVELSTWHFDDKENCIPDSYMVSASFCCYSYTLFLNTKDLQCYENGGFLDNSGCDGPTLFINEVDSYYKIFQNEADELVEKIKKAWEDFKENSPYNYYGKIEETINE